jgi:hypothetical protein
MTEEVELEGKAKIDRRAPTFKIRNFIDPEQLKKDMSFSTAALSSAMSEQASLLVHYGTLFAKAARQVDDIQMLLEITESKVYRKLRDEAVKSGAKMTEATLEKSVAVHDQVVAMKRARNEAKQIEAHAKIAVEGFRHRRDMLVQEGATQRQEMQGETSINARNERESAARASERRVLEMMSTRASSE